MLKLLHVVGARPNFMKVAPVLQAGNKHGGLQQILLHTGQHYDAAMSDRFFEELGLPEPDVNLGVGSATHAVQTGKILIEFDPVLERERPDWVVVYGDVNSTVACALAAVKRGIRVAHVEAGLRSFDRTMPEEINRIVTDQLADLCLTPSRDGNANLEAEGIPIHRVKLVGNVMVDTLFRLRPVARERNMPAELGVEGREFAFVTLHRPSNVDSREVLTELLEGLRDVASVMPVIFPIHPRTRKQIDVFGISALIDGIRLLDPLGYIETVSLLDQAAIVLTDSGGLQEETTMLGVPCLTMRPNTERPVTITEGTNRLIESTRAAMLAAFNDVMNQKRNGGYRPGSPEGWDGRAGERVIAALFEESAGI
jgi:UDP-N-acetylglucosamine 2-epimerase (non-hydrolysing)